MTTFLLHAGFALREHPLNAAFWERLVRDIKSEGTVLVVNFAVRDDNEVKQKFESITHCILRAAGDKKICTILAEKEHLIQQLQLCDAVYIQGGSTSKLLRVLREYPELCAKLKEKQIIAGSSAGAYALVQYGASHSERVVRAGLGCVLLRLVCHFQSTELPPSRESVELLEESHDDLPLITLRDFEWKEIEG